MFPSKAYASVYDLFPGIGRFVIFRVVSLALIVGDADNGSVFCEQKASNDGETAPLLLLSAPPLQLDLHCFNAVLCPETNATVLQLGTKSQKVVGEGDHTYATGCHYLSDSA